LEWPLYRLASLKEIKPASLPASGYGDALDKYLQLAKGFMVMLPAGVCISVPSLRTRKIHAFQSRAFAWDIFGFAIDSGARKTYTLAAP
jgi:hypothetical protein